MLIGCLLLAAPTHSQLVAPEKPLFTLSNLKVSAPPADQPGIVVSFTFSPAPADQPLYVCFFAPATGSGASLESLTIPYGSFDFGLLEGGVKYETLKAETGDGKQAGSLLFQEVAKDQAASGAVSFHLNHPMKFQSKESFPTTGALQVAVARKSPPLKEPFYAIISNVLSVQPPAGGK